MGEVWIEVDEGERREKEDEVVSCAEIGSNYEKVLVDS